MFAMDMPSPGAPVEITPRKPATLVFMIFFIGVLQQAVIEV